MNNNKQSWREFYEAEEDFYRHLGECQLMTTVDDCKAEFEVKTLKSGKQISVPPAYVRQVYKVTASQFKALQRQWSDLENHWIALMASEGKSTSRPPARFPKFIENVEEVAISSHPAYSSKLLNGKGNLAICRYLSSEMEFAEKDKLALSKIGVGSTIVGVNATADNKSSMATLNLMVNQLDIMNYFSNVPLIRYRRPSGKHYRARVVLKDQFRAERNNLGLLICTGNFSIVQNTKPREIRAHATEKTKDPLLLGCHLHGLFVSFFNDDE